MALTVSFITVFCAIALEAKDERHRVIVLTDMGDSGDIQSMVRFLLYTNDFEMEALVASAAIFANTAVK